jgi:hypothetical protein
MWKSLLLGAFFGGLAAFIWSSISWELLGWHEKPMLAFQNEDDVATVIQLHTTQSGVYLLPGAPRLEGMTADQKKAAQSTLVAKMQKGTDCVRSDSARRFRFLLTRPDHSAPFVSGRCIPAHLDASTNQRLELRG